MIYLAQYSTHKSVEEMNGTVKEHVYHNNDKLPSSNKVVLNVLSKHSLQHTGACTLRIATIAKEAGCSETTVSRALKRLAELKNIEVVKGTKRNGIQGANI